RSRRASRASWADLREGWGWRRRGNTNGGRLGPVPAPGHTESVECGTSVKVSSLNASVKMSPHGPDPHGRPRGPAAGPDPGRAARGGDASGGSSGPGDSPEAS